LSSKLTKNRLKRLDSAYDDYEKGRLNKLTGLAITVVGFSLGTLSSTEISDIVNVIIMFCVGVIMLFLVKKEENDKTNKLKTLIESLEEEHENKTNKDELLKEISKYNVWKSLGIKAFRSTSTLILCALFSLYATIEHVLRLVCN
jgi:hypothetical protein